MNDKSVDYPVTPQFLNKVTPQLLRANNLSVIDKALDQLK